MWRDKPDTNLSPAQLHIAELIYEAAQNRLAKLGWEGRHDSLAGGPLYGLRSGVGRVLVSVGSTLAQREAPCNDPCSDCA
jgi:hypothetical protein